ncbi:MAG: hypothetical protein ACKO2Z_29210, partial [Sphaerospermopsis kisseleviana]
MNPIPLTSQAAKIILGNPNKPEQLAIPLAPTPITMFGPRAACLLAPSGPLWVSDTGHHRVLGWRNLPMEDNQPADLIIGQPDFFSEG